MNINSKKSTLVEYSYNMVITVETIELPLDISFSYAVYSGKFFE